MSRRLKEASPPAESSALVAPAFSTGQGKVALRADLRVSLTPERDVLEPRDWRSSQFPQAASTTTRGSVPPTATSPGSLSAGGFMDGPLPRPSGSIQALAFVPSVPPGIRAGVISGRSKKRSTLRNDMICSSNVLTARGKMFSCFTRTAKMLRTAKPCSTWWCTTRCGRSVSRRWVGAMDLLAVAIDGCLPRAACRPGRCSGKRGLRRR
eukprot:scaffold63289_cov28-Tisochrysis_lutea.AAC.3